MLQLKEPAPFRAAIALIPDASGVDSVVTIVKGTFALRGGTTPPAEEQPEIVAADRYRGDPASSGLAWAGELGLAKGATDVLLIGSAYAPRGIQVTEMEVTLRVGGISKAVRVVGNRVWEKRILGAAISAPLPFVTMPLTWELAFGGADGAEGSPRQAEPRNPVGAGFRLRSGSKPLEALKLPNLEHPLHPIRSWSDRPLPAGFGPICPHWEPRLGYAGTYDELWATRRAPYLPEDFDSRFFQVAPSDQVCNGYLRGGEDVEVIGACPLGTLQFQLPAIRLDVRYRVDGADTVVPANLDTVVIEPDHMRLTLLWRAQLQCDKRALRVSRVEPLVARAG